jgi:deoxyribose-phosphate aldolase
MENLNQYIDHTLLKPDATSDDIQKLCEEAKTYQFFSICIQPCHVAKAAMLLKGSGVNVCTVVGFPLGANLSQTKVFETNAAITQGATEIDVVINIGALKEKNFSLVEQDIRSIVEAAGGATVKVIIETALLTDKEIIYACEASSKAGAHFVKTSTGFSSAGAKVEHIAMMKNSIPIKVAIKASGGIKTLADAKAMIEAGATRLGTSSGVTIMEGILGSKKKVDPFDSGY